MSALYIRFANSLSLQSMNMAGIVKDVVLVALSVTLFHSTVTPLQFVGYSVALAGVARYSLSKKMTSSTDAALAERHNTAAPPQTPDGKSQVT